MVIGTYYTIGYQWLLVVILFMAFDGYSIYYYCWLLMAILFIVIVGY